MKTVLLVEDNDTMLHMMLILLNAKGYAVRACKTGEEAIASMRDRLPDILLTDYFLPGIDGMQLAAWARQQPNGQRILIMMVTASDASKIDYIRPELVALKMEVKHKPFELDNFYERLSSLAMKQDEADALQEGQADG